MDKTHQSAVVIIPPREVWEPIQAIRRAHDKRFARWMPHLTLMYPFVPKREFTKVLPDLAQVGWAQKPFELTLARFNSFRHGQGGYIVWLEPTPAERVVALQRALTRALPHFGDTGSSQDGFTPHLSVGQVGGVSELKKLLRDLERDWQPLSFTVSEISLISRKNPPNDRFQVNQRILLEG